MEMENNSNHYIHNNTFGINLWHNNAYLISLIWYLGF